MIGKVSTVSLLNMQLIVTYMFQYMNDNLNLLPTLKMVEKTDGKINKTSTMKKLMAHSQPKIIGNTAQKI